jgi:hypothetical protein
MSEIFRQLAIFLMKHFWSLTWYLGPVRNPASSGSARSTWSSVFVASHNWTVTCSAPLPWCSEVGPFGAAPLPRCSKVGPFGAAPSALGAQLRSWRGSEQVLTPGLYVLCIDCWIYQIFLSSWLACTSDPVLAHILEDVLLITQVHNDIYCRYVVGAAVGGQQVIVNYRMRTNCFTWTFLLCSLVILHKKTTKMAF